jgi:hypothetical protein
MPVQDDERERELVRLFNLFWDPAHERAGTDAHLEVTLDQRRFRVDVEVKSTTGETVSTARDVGMDHIRKWRGKFFVIGYYTRDARRPELRHCVCLSPSDMEPWIRSIEEKIRPDFELAARSAKHLTDDDLFAICGRKSAYTIDDAKRLHKNQWSARQYRESCDQEFDGKPLISARRMLEILRLRLKYISERGATLNNPHITKQHLRQFANTDRTVYGEWAASIRTLALNYIRSNPNHPFVQE